MLARYIEKRLKTTQLAVVGAGPAGLSASIEAARAGLKVTLIDENDKVGGQLFKQIHQFFGSEAHYAGMRGFNMGQKMLEEINNHGNIEVLLNTVVYGLFEEKIFGLTTAKKSWELKADRIILATGASENALAFPGWTLPGVMGAGAIQTLVNIHRVLPSEKILMVGAGNVGLIVSYQLLQAGAEVVAVVEATPKIGGYGIHASKLRRAGVSILTSHTVKEVKGKKSVESATLIKLDSEMQPIPGTEKTLDVDTVCLAVGLTPLSELALMAGCKFMYIPQLGGHVPVHDQDMETTIPGIYVAGDVAGIGEASTAMEEGKLAGISAAESLGYIEEKRAEKMKEEIRGRLEGLRAGTFGSPLDKSKEQLMGASKVGAPIETSNQNPTSVKSEIGEEGLIYTGIPSEEELQKSPGYPTEERLMKGPVAVIECIQDIPCDPCEKACPTGAIKIGTPITNLPILDVEKCNGCGVCVSRCPGLAIFVINPKLTEKEALIHFPHEFLPLPKAGEKVEAVNRMGETVCKGKIIDIEIGHEKTPVISMSIPKEFTMEVRGMKRIKR